MAQETRDSEHVVVSMVIAWLMGPVYQLAFKLPTTFVVDGQCKSYQWATPQIGRAMGIFNGVYQFIIPLIIFCGTYAHMAYLMRVRVQPSGTTDGTGNQNMSRARKNVIKTLIVVCVAFVICWMTNQVYFVLLNFGFQLDLTTPLYHTSVLLVFMNFVINPFIYLATYRAYQRALWRAVGRVTCGRVGLGEGVEDGSLHTRNNRTE